MKKMKRLSMALIMIITLFVGRVYAADVEVDHGGWKKVGENEVQIYKLPIKDGQLTADASKFEVVTNEHYTDAEYGTNGRFNQERNSGKLTYNETYSDAQGNSKVVVFKQQLATGTHNDLGSFSMRWSNAAELQDGTICDVKITIDVKSLKIGESYTRPLEILANDSNMDLWINTRYAKQECEASDQSTSQWNAEKNLSRKHQIGAKYDISYEIYRAGTDEKIENKNMVFKFEDLDQSDKTDGYPGHFCSDGTADSSGSKKCPTGSSYGTPATYAEGITLNYGVSDKAYMDNNGDWLNIANTSAGANTRFSAKKGASTDTEEDLAGFTTRFNSSTLKYTWTGSDCGTGIGHILSKKVETSTSGQYPNNIHIAPTDNKVFWKEDKKVYFHTDPGYTLSRVTVDGSMIDIASKVKSCPATCTGTDASQCEEHKNAGGTCYYYEFADVVADHKIDVQCTKQEAYVNVYTRVDGVGGTIEGDEKVKYGNDSTKDKIKMRADSGYVISKVTINGQPVNIAENLESLVLDNFKNMTEDKLVVVSFKPKPTTVVVEKTSANTPLIIQVAGITSILLAAAVAYLYKTGKLSTLLKK